MWTNMHLDYNIQKCENVVLAKLDNYVLHNIYVNLIFLGAGFETKVWTHITNK